MQNPEVPRQDTGNTYFRSLACDRCVFFLVVLRRWVVLVAAAAADASNAATRVKSHPL